MRKIPAIVFILLFATILFMNCENNTGTESQEEKHYAYEVTNVSHRQKYVELLFDGSIYNIYIELFWDDPADENFDHVTIYPFYAYQNIVVVNNNHIENEDSYFVFIIKCVDRFGNNSKGIQYRIEKNTLYPHISNIEPYDTL